MAALFIKLVAIVAGCFCIVVLTWPYVLRNPLTNFITALGAAKKFPASILMNFNGEAIRSTSLPENYLFTYLGITVPVLLLIVVPLSLILLALNVKRIKWKPTLVILVTSVFPIVYALASHMYLYNGWRHLLFMYPGFMVIGGLGIDYALGLIRKPVLQWGLTLLCCIALLHPIAWSIRNNPYQYMYYNEIKGFKSAYADYENDVWSVSVKPAVDWLVKNKQLEQVKDSITIATNTSEYVYCYLKTHYPQIKAKIVFSGAMDYCDFRWDYLILNTVFLPTNYLQNNYPPARTIHEEQVDGLPITVVVQDTSHIEYNIVKAILRNDLAGADVLVNRYLASDKQPNPFIYGKIAIVKARTGKFDEAIKYGKQAVAAFDGDVFGHSALCFTYYYQHNLEAAVGEINTCLSIAPNDGFILQLADSISAKLQQ